MQVSRATGSDVAGREREDAPLHKLQGGVVVFLVLDGKTIGAGGHAL